MQRFDYFETIRTAGFIDLTLIEDRPWRTGPAGVDASALTLRAFKPKEAST